MKNITPTQTARLLRLCHSAALWSESMDAYEDALDYGQELGLDESTINQLCEAAYEHRYRTDRLQFMFAADRILSQ